MGNKVSVLLVLVVSGFIPGLGLLLVPERGTFSTLCAVLYLIAGVVGFAGLFVFGIGIFIWVPAMFVSGTHALIAAQSHNKKVTQFRATDSAAKADLEERVSQLSDV